MAAKRAFHVLERPADATVPVKVTYLPMLNDCHEPQVGLCVCLCVSVCVCVCEFLFIRMQK